LLGDVIRKHRGLLGLGSAMDEVLAATAALDRLGGQS
jgi:hypothetical protein